MTEDLDQNELPEFDDFALDDVLQDGQWLAAEPGFKNFIKRPDALRGWFEGADELINQASRQVEAAGEVPLEWHLAEAEFRKVLEKMFDSRNLKIRVIHTPAK